MILAASDERYAIYFVPRAESELYRFGASVLGYDCYTGNEMRFPRDAVAHWADKTSEPRKYGFHATLKPPFRLAAGTSPSELTAAVDAFARGRASLDVAPLRVAVIGAFVALVPAEHAQALNDLAAACVQEFDRFRAPLNDKEITRRLKPPLGERQRAYLDRWGYPFVLDEFRFHMTLTGSLMGTDLAEASRWLQAEFAGGPAAQRLAVDRLVVAHQAGDGAFTIVHCAELSPRK